MPEIYYISRKDLEQKDTIEIIQSDLSLQFFWTKDWSAEFYSQLASEGFISTTYRNEEGDCFLIPEMQKEYAVLDWKNLHISGHIRKLLKQKDLYQLKINNNLPSLLNAIRKYHKECWITDSYEEVLMTLHNQDNPGPCRVISVELYDSGENLAAGEVGYRTGAIYTSLSGFFRREKAYSNWGKLQMVLLSRYLEKQGYAFWNLGHAGMEYKRKLGAEILKRDQFLNRWKEFRNSPLR